MRDYTENNRKNIVSYLRSAHSGSGRDYRDPYRTISVADHRRNLKYDCMMAGGDAYYHIKAVREKIDATISIITKFYSEVDENAKYINNSAASIIAILDEVNAAIVRMNDALNGVGNYAGKKVTPDDLKAAGVNEKTCSDLKEKLWNDFMENDLAVALYIENMKALAESGTIPPEDMAKLNKIYDWYVENRYGSSGDINLLSEQYLRNCIDAYELIDPKAKEVVHDFFLPAEWHSTPESDLNVLKIKYTMYTADKVYRDIMLEYLPKLKLNLLNKGERAFHCGGVINVDLYSKSTDCCAFFHELGHGIDDASFEDKDGVYKRSQSYEETLVSDLKISMRDALKTMGVPLSAEKANEVFDFILSNENVNLKDTWRYYIPSSWTPDQVLAFERLRSYYGYIEYSYPGTGGNAYSAQGHSGVITFKDPKNGILNDVIGGLTNNQIGYVHWGHGASINQNQPYPYDLHCEDDIHDYLTGYNYWYSDADNDYTTPETRTTHASSEFFAENFDYSVRGVDLTPTRNVFGNAGAQYDQIIDDLYNGR